MHAEAAARSMRLMLALLRNDCALISAHQAADVDQLTPLRHPFPLRWPAVGLTARAVRDGGRGSLRSATHRRGGGCRGSARGGGAGGGVGADQGRVPGYDRGLL